MMKLTCNVRLSALFVKNSFVRPVLSDLWLGVRARDPFEPLLVLSTSYITIEFKVTDNVRRVYKEEVFQGRAGIEFFSPPHHVLVTKSRADELENFLALLYQLMDRAIMERLEYIPILNQLDHPSSRIKCHDFQGMLPHERLKENINTKCIQIRQVNHLKQIDLPNCSLSEIPVELGEISVERINLQNNEITYENLAWLEEIEIRKSLKFLNLAGNKIDTFPSVLIDYDRLIMINFRDNRIETIPHGMGEMCSLKYLNMSGNNLRVLPATLPEKRFLEVDLTYNHLTSNVRLSFRPKLRNAGKNCAKLADIALLKVQRDQRKRLTTDRYPRRLLENLRQISQCICGRRTVPCSEAQFYTRLYSANFALNCKIHPQKLDFSDEPLYGLKHKGNGIRNIFLQRYLCGQCEDEYVEFRPDSEHDCFRLSSSDDPVLPSTE